MIVRNQLEAMLITSIKWLEANDRARHTALGAGILLTSVVIGYVFPTVPVMLVIGFIFIAASMFVGYLAEASYGFFRSNIESLIGKRSK